MHSARNVIAVASEMIARYGRASAAMMEKRAEENTRAGDTEAAAFWGNVARAVRALDGKPLHSKPASDNEKNFESLFRPAFQATPHPYLLLSPNLRIVNANDAYIAVTMTRRSDLIGSDLFDAFPDNPDHLKTNAVSNLRASLMRVLDDARPNRMAIQRYDIRDPDGIFEERWWKPLNIPVFDDDGRIGLILHHVEDVTADQLAA